MSDFHTFVDGAPAASIPVFDRGLAYGHGLFETMRLSGGSLPLWSLHRERLARGLELLGIPLAVETIDVQLRSCLARLPGDGVIKLIVTGGVGARGYAPLGDTPGSTIIQWMPVPLSMPSVALYPCRYRLPDNPVLAGVKHLNRLDQVLAAAEVPSGFQGLVMDSRDNVVEAVSHNLFCRIDGQWYTPVLNNCGVAGVMRHYLMSEVFPDLGMSVREVALSVDELASAQEAFLSNAVHGIVPVIAIDGVKQWITGAETRQVQQRLADLHNCFGA
ncbi:MAG: aminodeoxychorismate lyase [Porticoccaceae bacterium]|nr:aminodeoxychorismate lyase [Porticoccaceae bacterium]